MKKKVYLMESFITYVNKGSVELDMDYFPELAGLSNGEIAQKLASGKYYVDWEGEVMPEKLPESLTPEIKAQWEDEDGSIAYDTEEMNTLWEYHNESEVDFDKIKNEEAYFIVEG